MDLQNLENRTRQLTEMAYEWCSVVCENYSDLMSAKDLLLLSLEIGFHHLDPEDPWTDANLTHTQHHQQMVEVVCEDGDPEAIANLLFAWTARDHSHEPHPSLKICAGHFIHLHHLQHFPPRLRQLVSHAIGLIGYEEFEQIGVDGFVRLLNSLSAEVGDMNNRTQWISLILDTIQSSEGIQNLSHQYWKSLTQLAVAQSWWPRDSTYIPHITTFLAANHEWGKLECWVGVVWMAWPPETGSVMEEIQHVIFSLFHQQPGAIQRLQQWMEQWSNESISVVPESFTQICNEACLQGVHQVGL